MARPRREPKVGSPRRTAASRGVGKDTEMLYGAPRQAIHLATDLRAGAREAAEHERTLSAAPAVVERRPAGPVPRRSLLTALWRHGGRPSAQHAGAR